MKILFLNNDNLYELRNPYADLIEISDIITLPILKALELKQLGVGQRGGQWKEIMEDGNIKYKLIKSGKQSDFNESEYEQEYKLISGNY